MALANCDAMASQQKYCCAAVTLRCRNSRYNFSSVKTWARALHQSFAIAQVNQLYASLGNRKTGLRSAIADDGHAADNSGDRAAAPAGNMPANAQQHLSALQEPERDSSAGINPSIESSMPDPSSALRNSSSNTAVPLPIAIRRKRTPLDWTHFNA